MGALNNFKTRLTQIASDGPDFVYVSAREAMLLRDRMSIRYHIWKNTPLVLIYQQGRVASTSLYESLLELDLAYPIFHLHTLSKSRAEALIQRQRERQSRVHRNLRLAMLLSDHVKWHIISVVRDPIAIMLSLHFLNPTSSSILEREWRDKEPASVVAEFVEMFSTDDPEEWGVCTWFNDVFLPETGVDVFGTEFDAQQGASIIETSKFRVLVMQFEKLNESFSDSISNFFGLSLGNIEFLHRNIHRVDEIGPLHDYVKASLELDDQTLDRIYGTRFVQHFYSPTDIARLRGKWGASGDV